MYKLKNSYMDGQITGSAVIKTNSDKTVSSFLPDPANTDFQEYQKWLAEGNEPLAADAPADQPTE
jgi:hypothetical protein